jgi:hypothetical protein
LCLTSVMVNTSSCKIVAFFISSIAQMNVLFIIAKFYYKAFKVCLVSFFPLGFFLASIKFHGVLDPIVFEQTQDL